MLAAFLKRHLIRYNRGEKKCSEICSMMKHAKNVNVFFFRCLSTLCVLSLFLCYSASQSWLLATTVFSNTSTHTHTHSLTICSDWQIADIKLISQIEITRCQNCNVVSYISALNGMMSKTKQNKTKLRQNQPNTSKKMHATSGLIAYMYFSIYIYILDMHNTWMIATKKKKK